MIPSTPVNVNFNCQTDEISVVGEAAVNFHLDQKMKRRNEIRLCAYLAELSNETVEVESRSAVGVHLTDAPSATASQLLARLKTAVSTEQIDRLEGELTRVASTAIAELQAIVRSEEPPQVRAAALRALVDSVPRAASELILPALRDREAQVRAVGAEGASEFLSDAGVVDELRRMAATDSSAVIRAVAADALHAS